jgi:ATP-dependent Clp protease, protease subunit
MAITPGVSRMAVHRSFLDRPGCRLFFKGYSPMPLVPIVIERSGREERAMDIYSRLLQDRIIILGTSIDDTVANLIVAQMLVLAHQDAKADIHLYVNSPGGSVTAGLAVYDTMQWVPCDVATYCIGQCASMGSLLLAAGTKGKRNALPHSRIMIHQPLAGVEGTATEILIHAEEFIRMKKQLNEIYQRHTGQTLERLQEDTDRDRFMGPEEAREYGLIDNVVDRAPDFPNNPERV